MANIIKLGGGGSEKTITLITHTSVTKPNSDRHVLFTLDAGSIHDVMTVLVSVHMIGYSLQASVDNSTFVNVGTAFSDNGGNYFNKQTLLLSGYRYFKVDAWVYNDGGYGTVYLGLFDQE